MLWENFLIGKNVHWSLPMFDSYNYRNTSSFQLPNIDGIALDLDFLRTSCAYEYVHVNYDFGRYSNQHGLLSRHHDWKSSCASWFLILNVVSDGKWTGPWLPIDDVNVAVSVDKMNACDYKFTLSMTSQACHFVIQVVINKSSLCFSDASSSCPT